MAAAADTTGIALTVVGGYLGAGKTTLLNRLLRHAGGRRLAVMVNDFGAINIDSELIASHDGETINLTNGCICCGLAGEFLFALAGLRDRHDPPDHVIVEASGVGDTATILGFGDTPGFARDAAIVVVDAETLRERAEHATTRTEVLAQLRSADLLVLNKIDLVTSDELAATRAWIREVVGPSTALVDASFGDVPPELLLGAGDASRATEGAGHASHGAKHEHAHTEYERFHWEGHAPLAGQGLVEALKALPEGIVRGKGFLHLREDPDNRFVLQLVGRRWTIERQRRWRDAEARGSRLVLIGLPGSIEAGALEATLERLAESS